MNQLDFFIEKIIKKEFTDIQLDIKFLEDDDLFAERLINFISKSRILKFGSIKINSIKYPGRIMSFLSWGKVFYIIFFPHTNMLLGFDSQILDKKHNYKITWEKKETKSTTLLH